MSFSQISRTIENHRNNQFSLVINRIKTGKKETGSMVGKGYGYLVADELTTNCIISVKKQRSFF